MRSISGQPLTPGLIPDDVCQPPVNAYDLADRLGEREIRDLVDTVIVWAPEVFEHALRDLSKQRQAERRRERGAGQ